MAESNSLVETKNAKPVAADSFTLYSFVDEVESRVEALRRQAAALIGERASLLMIIDQLKNDCLKCDISSEDCQELIANMERLMVRCEAVQMQVHTVRDEGQRQSLQKVNDVLQDLQTRLFSSDGIHMTVVQQARSYLNACLPEPVGAVDTRFQSLVLGCAVDDQKDVRRRLQTLVRECSKKQESNAPLPGNVNRNRAPPQQSIESAENSDSTHRGMRSGNCRPIEPDQQMRVGPEGGEQEENYLTAQFFSAPKDSFDGSDLCVTQQEGESIEQLHIRDENCSPRHHSHFDGPVNS